MVRCMILFTIFSDCQAVDEGQPGGAQEVRNERALFVYNRVLNKITGPSWFRRVLWTS